MRSGETGGMWTAGLCRDRWFGQREKVFADIQRAVKEGMLDRSLKVWSAESCITRGESI